MNRLGTLTNYSSLPEYSSIRTVLMMKDGETVEDVVIAEEPLEVSIRTPEGLEVLATTMRTPGNDLFLCLGYLRSEGILKLPSSVSRPEHCEENNNAVFLEYEHSPLSEDKRSHNRLGVQSSSCGVCGKTSLEDLLRMNYVNRVPCSRRWQNEDLTAISGVLREQQPLFTQTGGSHAVWLFDEENVLIASFEDVGRHNALDKLLGWAVMNEPDNLANMTLVLSSRLSYELIHKAAILGVWVVVAMGAPTSFSVELASKLEFTTLGFFKESSFNLYTNRLALYYEQP